MLEMRLWNGLYQRCVSDPGGFFEVRIRFYIEGRIRVNSTRFRNHISIHPDKIRVTLHVYEKKKVNCIRSDSDPGFFYRGSNLYPSIAKFESDSVFLDGQGRIRISFHRLIQYSEIQYFFLLKLYKSKRVNILAFVPDLRVGYVLIGESTFIMGYLVGGGDKISHDWKM